MTLRTCLRCDWEAETAETSCPSCGVPIYVSGGPAAPAPMSGRDHPEERGRDTANTSNAFPSSIPPSELDLPPTSTSATGSSGRSRHSTVAFALTALLTIALGVWIRTPDERSASKASTGDAAREFTGTDAAAPIGSSSHLPLGVGPIEKPITTRQSRMVAGVRFSFRTPAPGWERFGEISVNKSIRGPQGAEAIVFWTSHDNGEPAASCARVLSPPIGPSAANLAAAFAEAPGTRLLGGPWDVTVGGRLATHVVVEVRKDVGCDPGYFFKWQDIEGGALWGSTGIGDTIRVWIVPVRGTRLVIEAETTRQATPRLEEEIQQIVESIRFDQ